MTEFHPWVLPDEIPSEFSVGIIVGASGSGKSTLLRSFGEITHPTWDGEKAIASQFSDAEDAIARLTAVGLNSVPAWKQPYHTLSNGQQFRADLARSIGDGSVIDEFTSVVDRTVAASAAKGMRNYIVRANVKNMVVASCHRDVIDWLKPDWVIDTDSGLLTLGKESVVPRWYADYVRGDGAVAHVDLT